MSMRTSIKINSNLADKLKLLKEENNLASLNEVIEKLIPYAVNEEYMFNREPPAFTLEGSNQNIPVSYGMLKKSSTGKIWSTDLMEATVLFNDDYGCLIRFIDIDHDDVNVMYYHYLK